MRSLLKVLALAFVVSLATVALLAGSAFALFDTL